MKRRLAASKPPPCKRTKYSRGLLATVRRLQRFWRAYGHACPTNNTEPGQGTLGFQRKGGKNLVCCITQDKIPNALCFKFYSLTGKHVTLFSLPELVRYFETSGDFRCPLTREEMPAPAIRRMSRKALALGLVFGNLLSVFLNAKQLQHENTEVRNRELAIENQCSAAMADCLAICGDRILPSRRASQELINVLLPEWCALVDQYIRFFPNGCNAMLVSEKDKLTRLQRVDDPHRLLGLVSAAVNMKIASCNRALLATQEFLPALVRVRTPPSPRLNYRRPAAFEDSVAVISRRLFETLNDSLGDSLRGEGLRGEGLRGDSLGEGLISSTDWGSPPRRRFRFFLSGDGI